MIDIPKHHTMIDLNHREDNAKTRHFLKVIHVYLHEGDCVHIPAYWYSQIQALTHSKRPPPDAPKDDQMRYLSSLQKLSVSVDFWYNSTSTMLDNVMHGLNKQLLR